MSRDRFRLSRCALGIVAQEFGGAPVQNSTAALQHTLAGGVLHQRVLEAVVRPWPVALNEKDVGLGEPLQGRPEFGFGEAGDSLEKRLREVAPEYGADLRDLPGSAEPVKPGGERLLQSRRDRRRAPLDAAFQEEARYLFDEQGTPPLRSLTPSMTSWDSA